MKGMVEKRATRAEARSALPVETIVSLHRDLARVEERLEEGRLSLSDYRSGVLVWGAAMRCLLEDICEEPVLTLRILGTLFEPLAW